MPEEESIGSQGQQTEFYGKYVYDNQQYYVINKECSELVADMATARRNDTIDLLDRREIVEKLNELLDAMIGMASRYHCVDEIISDVIDKRTGERFTLQSFARFVDKAPVLHTDKVRNIFADLSRKWKVLLADRASMRKARSDKLPFLLRVAQKLQFNHWLPEEEDYLEKNKIRGLHRAAFLTNHYRVLEDGEVHMLVSGDNDSGKTGTAARWLIFSWKTLREFYRPYIEEHLAEGKYLKMDGTTYRKFDDLIPPKFRLSERMVLMDRKGRLSLLASSPFPDLLYDEGNFTNINLKSMDPETVDETIVAFGARNKHPLVLYNYQNSSRPTLFLREKFNMWFHKIHIKNGFWLIRQRLVVPGKDPWLVKKLDPVIESGSDDAIYGFFKRHPYTMMEYRNIRDMPKKMRRAYEKRRQKAQYELFQSRNAESMLSQAREKMATEYAQKIESGHMLIESLDQELIKERGVTSLAERIRIKNIINGLMTNKNLLVALTSKKPKEE